MKNTLILSILALTLSPIAMAELSAADRKENQEQKILNGLFTGDINRQEYRALERKQKKIEAYEAKIEAKAAEQGAPITQEQAKRLDQMQDNRLKAINNLKDNNNKKATVQIRDNHQAERIYNGIDDGSMTQAEAKEAQKLQAEIDAYKKLALEDGKYNEEEAKKLDQMQDRANKQIYRMRHNQKGVQLKAKSAQ